MTKETVKNSKSKEEKDKAEEIKKKLKKAGDEVVDKVNWLKKKFNEADSETKKKIVAGISTAAASLVVLAGLKRKNKK